MGLRVRPAMTGLLFILFLYSCASVHLLTIEVQEPADITFPPDIANILVVNNTAKQPGNAGITRTYNGVAIKDDIELNLDSVAWITTVSLLSHINETHFFKEISYYAEPLREDNDWLVAVPLSRRFREAIFDTQDGIISIDRILINLDEQVIASEVKRSNAVPYNPRSDESIPSDTLKQQNITTSKNIEIKLEAQFTCSVYLYDRESPLTSFTVSDTLSYREIFFENRDRSVIFKELPEYLMDELAYNIGEKLAYYFIPSWTLQDRIVYSGPNARMQEALSYTRTGKWDRAETIWMNEYAAGSKLAEKGKLANNIAVANEMQDKLKVALQWAEQAQEFFRESDSKVSSGDKLQINSYVEDLQKRIQDNQLLNIQLGVKE
jgi:hypothetical protein